MGLRRRRDQVFHAGRGWKTGDGRILRYKAVLGNATRWFSFTVTAEGKIAQILWW